MTRAALLLSLLTGCADLHFTLPSGAARELYHGCAYKAPVDACAVKGPIFRYRWRF
jgi:hypothetical protein